MKMTLITTKKAWKEHLLNRDASKVPSFPIVMWSEYETGGIGGGYNCSVWVPFPPTTSFRSFVRGLEAGIKHRDYI